VLCNAPCRGTRWVTAERWAGTWTVNLVYYNNGRQFQFQCFLEHKSGLRHRAFASIDQQQYPVYAAQHSLHLSAEVGVTGGVYDVDLDAVVVNCSHLRQDRDPAFPLPIVGVHYTFGHDLIVTKSPALPQDNVNEGGLAMVNMRDDRHVSRVLPVTFSWVALHHRFIHYLFQANHKSPSGTKKAGVPNRPGCSRNAII